MKYVMIVAGIIMLCFGVYMIGNASRGIVANKTMINDPYKYIMNNSFEDQNGEKIKLSDYKGKYVILNFVTTWCTYCKQEIPEYLAYSRTDDDVVCLYVMSSSTSRTSKENVLKFIDDNLELRTIIDEDNKLFSFFGVQSYPVFCLLDREGEYLGYQTGAMTSDMLKQIIDYQKQIQK